MPALRCALVVSGADGDTTLYQDDGVTYAYEKGESSVTLLHWDDSMQRLKRTGAQAWTQPDSAIIELVRP